jgi:hypothetical protein
MPCWPLAHPVEIKNAQGVLGAPPGHGITENEEAVATYVVPCTGRRMPDDGSEGLPGVEQTSPRKGSRCDSAF